jgi:hypothetical protein
MDWIVVATLRTVVAVRGELWIESFLSEATD